MIATGKLRVEAKPGTLRAARIFRVQVRSDAGDLATYTVAAVNETEAVAKATAILTDRVLTWSVVGIAG